MKVEIIKCLEDNFSYILINEANRNCCVVDPGEADPIINYLEKIKNLRFNQKKFLSKICVLLITVLTKLHLKFYAGRAFMLEV